MIEINLIFFKYNILKQYHFKLFFKITRLICLAHLDPVTVFLSLSLTYSLQRVQFCAVKVSRNDSDFLLQVCVWVQTRHNLSVFNWNFQKS